MEVVRTLALVLAVVLVASGLYLFALAVRARHPQEMWTFVGGYVVLCIAAGVAAAWLAFGGGAVSGWTFVGLILAHEAWREVARRRIRRSP